MHAITVSVADKMRPHIPYILWGHYRTDPRKAWLTLREVNEHATASKRQCLETEQDGLKQDRLIEGVSSRAPNVELELLLPWNPRSHMSTSPSFVLSRAGSILQLIN